MAEPKMCSVETCDRATDQGRNMCPMHYSRVRRHGDPNYEGKRRPITETEAWCNKGQHMVPHDGFGKGQRTCKQCRNTCGRSNYTKGKTCDECGTPIANTNRGGLCQTHWEKRRAANRRLTPSRRYITATGYVVLSSQWDHPNANLRGDLREHTKVMSEVLGRPLAPGESVHHINGVRDDNRPENLELWSVSQPAGQRVSDKVEWAKELLSLYEPEALIQPMMLRVVS